VQGLYAIFFVGRDDVNTERIVKERVSTVFIGSILINQQGYRASKIDFAKPFGCGGV
jgi:hypothetical protein